MKIDHLIIQSLMTWARAENRGQPVTLQIGPSPSKPGRIVCDAYSRDLNGKSLADFMRPISRNVIGKL